MEAVILGEGFRMEWNQFEPGEDLELRGVRLVLASGVQIRTDLIKTAKGFWQIQLVLYIMSLFKN